MRACWLRKLFLCSAAHVYSGGFIEYWLQQLLYYELPSWVFGLSYSLFGALVGALWFYFPPKLKAF